MKTYFAFVNKKGTDYQASFKEFPGCVASGPTIEATLRAAKQCLTDHIEVLIKDNAEIPTPTKTDILMTRLDGALTIMGVPHERPHGVDGNCCGSCGS